MAKRTAINRDECVKISMDIPKTLRIRVKLSAAVRDIGVGPEIVRALTEYYQREDRRPGDMVLIAGTASNGVQAS